MSLIDTARLLELAEVEFSDIVFESHLSEVPVEALREFLFFVRAMLRSSVLGN